MANYILDEFMQQQKAQQDLQAGATNIAGQKVLNTLNDLRAKEMGQRLAPGSPESLLRQLQGMTTQADIENFPTTQKTKQFQSKAEMVQAADDYMQKQLDVGRNGQEVADEMVQQGILPPGIQAKKLYDPELGEQIWNFRAPGGEWTPFNKDVIKERRALSTRKSLETWTQDEAANAKLKAAGYRWTKGNNLEVIPGGPADTGDKMSWDSMTGAPNIMKLHAYRQQLMDQGAPQKLIDEVNGLINKPDTVAQILTPIYRATLRGEPLTEEQVNTLDLYRTYGNPFAQMLDQGIEESGVGLKARLKAGTEGGRVPEAPADPQAFAAFYGALESGASFKDPEGKTRTKP